jgi:hypothetical protein
MTVTALKRLVKASQRVDVINHLHPHVSGAREVVKVQSNSLCTRLTDGRSGWVDWPKAALCRVEGTTLHFLDDSNPERIAFSYIFHLDGAS